MLADLDAKHALLLQGPMGGFFRRFANDLQEAGLAVTKVNFNGGDRLYFRGAEVVEFRRHLAEWPAFLERLIDERGIDVAFLFGDGRPVHRAAIPVLQRLGVKVYVFEEGYLRPNFITMERNGVNGYSSLPKDPQFYREARRHLPTVEAPLPVGPSFRQAAVDATFYVLAMAASARRFPFYEHHRVLTPVAEAKSWVTSGLRKLWYERREAPLLARFEGPLEGCFFFVPLQVHSDYQLAHSRFESIEAFIIEICHAFAADAPASFSLVLKHHPLDRGYRDYTELVARLRIETGLGDRLYYVHDLFLPKLLRAAAGVITINSTVGLQALHHRTPVKVLGDAVYDIPGLTHQGTLPEFLAEPGTVDAALYRAFRHYLLSVNQANGSFQRQLPEAGRGTGIRWFPGAGEPRRD